MHKKHYFSLGALSPLRWLKSLASIFFLACWLWGQLTYATTVPAANFLLPNGTLNTTAIGNQSLSLDLKGWNVTLDPTLGPVFAPAPVAANGFSPLDKGLNSVVFAVAVSGSDVYVGGYFTGVGSGGTAVTGLNKIAKWNGTAWSALGSGLNNTVLTITVSGSDVYVGGYFTGVGSGGTAVTGLNNIAKWNGTAWSALGSGLGDSVYAIAVSGSDVYVGGAFNYVGPGGTAVEGLNSIAKWNGTAWSALDKGLNNTVSAIAVSGSNVYVGGGFDAVYQGGTYVEGLNNIAKWNGTAWSALDKGLNDYVNTIAISGSDVYVGGIFTGVGSFGTAVEGLNSIAKWNGSAWSALGRGLNKDVNTIAVSGSDVYVGGYFTGVGTGGTAVTGLNYIAKWNGTAWSALDKGLNNLVLTITVSGSDVYAGGGFTDVGPGGTGCGLNNIAKWGVAPSLICTSGTLTPFSACAGAASTEQNFTVSGSNLKGGITLSAPTGFEISTTSLINFGAAATLPSSGGTVYVRMASTATGTPSGNVTLSSTDATTQNVAVSGTVNTTNLQAGTSTPTVCIGQSINLTANLVSTDQAPGTPNIAPTNPVADSYAWAGPAGSGYTSASQNPSVSVTASSLAFGGVYSVTVTSSGCTASATASVAVNNKPTLNAGSTTPSVCIGQSISLTAGAGASSYSWVGPVGTNYASDSQNPSVTASSLAYSGIYSVSASFDGCTASATTSISVKALPVPNPGTSTPSVCVGQSIRLTAAAGSSSYAWAGPAGSNYSSDSQNPTTTASSTAFGGTYSVTVTSNGCSASATTSLSVKPRPNLLAGPVSPSVCVGQSISLTARLDAPGTPGTPSITTGNSSNDTYAWAGPSNFTSNIQTPTPFIASSTAWGGTYSVTVTSTSNGCSASVTTSLTVITIPLASISPNTTQSICQGLPLSLQAAGTGPFAWTGPNGFSLSTATAPINTSSSANSGVYRLTVGSGNCTASTSVSVTISPAALSVSPASLTVCLGQAINLSANATPAASALSWKGPAGFSSAAQTASTYATTTANLGVYSVSATIGSCTVSTTAEVKSGAILKAGVVGMPCVGGTIQFTASGMTSYTWSRPTNNFNSTLQNPVIPSSTMNDAGVYFLSGRSGSCVASALVPVSLLGPGINPTFSVSPSSVTAGATVSLSAASATGTYSWSGPNGFSGTTRTKSISNFQAVNNGVYRLTVTNGACSGYTEKTISINSATRLATAENEPIEMEINAYPNPVSNTLSVEIRLKEPASLKLTLLNQLGQSSGQWLLNQETTLHKAELNLSSMQAGIYLLQAQTPTQQASKRIFKLE